MLGERTAEADHLSCGVRAGCEAESIGLPPFLHLGDLSLERSFLLVHKLHTQQQSWISSPTTKILTSTHETSRMAKNLHENLIVKIHRFLNQEEILLNNRSDEVRLE